MRRLYVQQYLQRGPRKVEHLVFEPVDPLEERPPLGLRSDLASLMGEVGGHVAVAEHQASTCQPFAEPRPGLPAVTGIRQRSEIGAHFGCPGRELAAQVALNEGRKESLAVAREGHLLHGEPLGLSALRQKGGLGGLAGAVYAADGHELSPPRGPGLIRLGGPGLIRLGGPALIRLGGPHPVHVPPYRWKMRMALSLSSKRATCSASSSLPKPASTKSRASTCARTRRYMLNFASPNSSLYMSL